MHENDHPHFMQQALSLAALGQKTVSPNPMVGCVIVKAGKIIANGYHEKAGGPHAEIVALNATNEDVRDATLYVTLEPCCHHGKTPPCTDAIIKAGIKEVYIATRDPNPLVAGRGIEQLERAGIKTHLGLLQPQAEMLNTVFFHNMQKQRPYVIAKWAMSLDGKTSTNQAKDRNITSSDTQLGAHTLRQQVDAILIGHNTAEKDNPRLTARNQADISKQPLRVVMSDGCQLPLTLKIFDSALPGKTVIATRSALKAETTAYCKQHDIDILFFENLSHLLQQLYARGVCSLLIEGGMQTHRQFLQAKLVDKVQVYVAPIIIGNDIEKTYLHNTQLSAINNDFLFSGTIEELTHV